jgi:hypothetical protein
VLQEAGGNAVKFGSGPTYARWRIANPAAARAWLHDWLAQCD